MFNQPGSLALLAEVSMGYSDQVWEGLLFMCTCNAVPSML